MTRAEYWEHTPYQWRERVEAYTEARQQEMDAIKYAAWVNANLTRAKRMPSLSSFINEGRQYSGSEMERMRDEAAKRAEGWPKTVS